MQLVDDQSVILRQASNAAFDEMFFNARELAEESVQRKALQFLLFAAYVLPLSLSIWYYKRNLCSIYRGETNILLVPFDDDLYTPAANTHA